MKKPTLNVMPVHATNTFERKLVFYQFLLKLVIDQWKLNVSYLSLKGHRKVVCQLISLHGHQVDECSVSRNICPNYVIKHILKNPRSTCVIGQEWVLSENLGNHC